MIFGEDEQERSRRFMERWKKMSTDPDEQARIDALAALAQAEIDQERAALREAGLDMVTLDRFDSAIEDLMQADPDSSGETFEVSGDVRNGILSGTLPATAVDWLTEVAEELHRHCAENPDTTYRANIPGLLRLEMTRVRYKYEFDKSKSITPRSRTRRSWPHVAGMVGVATGSAGFTVAATRVVFDLPWPLAIMCGCTQWTAMYLLLEWAAKKGEQRWYAE